MKYAINLHALLPLRKEAKESSELETQLLFGECCEVFEDENTFVRVKNKMDGYEGFVAKKMLTMISAEEFEQLQSQAVFRVCVPIADVFCTSDKSIYRLPAGSLLPNYKPDTSRFGFGNIEFQIHPTFVTHLPVDERNRDGIVPLSKHFLNAPYLWGGKSVMGIDCSGFVQSVFALNGYSLPRNASQQALLGKELKYDEAQAGDLFFFSTNDKITHVGIYLGEDCIIHASGSVRIDATNSTGILSKENDLTYTHHLSQIKRIE